MDTMCFYPLVHMCLTMRDMCCMESLWPQTVRAGSLSRSADRPKGEKVVYYAGV